jgi:hypothetical protein
VPILFLIVVDFGSAEIDFVHAVKKLVYIGLDELIVVLELFDNAFYLVVLFKHPFLHFKNLQRHPVNDLLT